MNTQTPVDTDVTVWVQSLRDGCEESAERLWKYCLPRLLRYSRSRLPQELRKALDEEDVALSAFNSLCQDAERGGLAAIKNRDDLWKLLKCITSRKAVAAIRYETRKKRGGGRVSGESVFANTANKNRGIDDVLTPQPSPESCVEFDDHLRHMLDLLEEDLLKTIALLRLEGLSVGEISERVGCARRSTERRLQLIRRIWENEIEG